MGATGLIFIPDNCLANVFGEGALLVDLLVVLPTLNERQNVGIMAQRISAVLQDVSYRIIFVDDDSTDGTRDELALLSETDAHVTFLHRIGRSGLSSAVIEGALAATSKFIVVMDADLQHDEKLLPQMLDLLRKEPLDIVIASRFAPGASLGDFAESRVKTSERGIMLAQKILSVPVSDPLTGYFMMRREFFEGLAPTLQPRGFKILLDILHKAGSGVRYKEIPLIFGTRLAGESKLDASVGFDFLAQLYDAKFEGFLPLSILLGFLFALILFAAAAVVLIVGKALGSSTSTASILAMIIPGAISFWLKMNSLRRRQRPKGTDLTRVIAAYCSLTIVLNLPLILLANMGANSTLGDMSFLYLLAIGITGASLLSYFSFPMRPRRKVTATGN